MRRPRVIIVILWGLLAAALIVVGSIAVMVISTHRGIASAEARISAPKACQPAAIALAKLCQSDARFHSHGSFSPPPWTPREITALSPSWLEIAKDEARVEFGGGLHHFGYELKLDTSKSTETENAWVLSFYSETADARLLYAFTLAKNAHIESPSTESASQ